MALKTLIHIFQNAEEEEEEASLLNDVQKMSAQTKVKAG